ncbi:hypothetical protein [Ruegeria atlantica]|uniref:hypothetical protein n=1 Tax=Ruegeria atlantica TaxID=81569 RepID=UPI00147B6CAF|nr:hypothetical protein [Ruegeria atlantica]
MKSKAQTATLTLRYSPARLDPFSSSVRDDGKVFRRLPMADGVLIFFLLSNLKACGVKMVFVKLAASPVCAVLAANAVYSDNLTQARSLVEAFCTNMINEKYDAAIDMFLPDAKAASGYDFEKAYPKEKIAYSPQDLKQYIDAENLKSINITWKYIKKQARPSKC